jgi:hypothetical protein
MIKPRSFSDKLVTVVLFAAILSGYLLSGNRAPFDSALYLHTSLSLVREGNTDLNEYPEVVAQVWWPPDQIDGRWYDTAPIGTPVLLAPIMLAVDRLSTWLGLGDFNDYLTHNLPENLQSVLASVIVALTAVLLYHIARRELSQFYAVLLAVMFAFGTSAWSVVSRTLWQHDLSILMLTLALYVLLVARAKPARIQYLGLIVAAAYVIRPTNSIAVMVYTLFVLLFYRRFLWRYLAWAAVIAVPFVWYSLAIYHALLPPYYRAFSLLSGTTFFQALVGHLVSPSRGLLIFSPLLILALIGIVLKIKQRPWRREDGVLLSIIGLHWIVVSLWWNWWAGVSYGPRIWTDMLPYLMYFIIPTLTAFATLRGKRRWVAAIVGLLLIGWSVWVHYRGANAAVVMDWNGSPAPIDSYPQRVWDWRDPQWLRGVTFGPPVDLAVSGIPYDQVIDPDLQARLGSRHIQARQFDASSALIAPAGEAWFAVAEHQPIGPELAALLADAGPQVEGHTLAEYPPYRLYHFNLADHVQQAAQQAEQTTLDAKLPIKFGDTAELMGYQLAPSVDGLTLITYWRAGEHIISPLKLFVHALGPDGAIVAQDDRLDVPAELWQTGDWIAQVNRVTVPPDKQQVTIAIGLYNSETNTRLPINLNGQTTDRLLLRPIDLK